LDHLIHGAHGESVSTSRFLFFGALFSFAESSVIYPIELTKTILQVNKSRSSIFCSFSQTFKYIWKHEGMRGFYKGFAWWEIAGLPSQLLFFTSYNYVKHLHLVQNHFSSVPKSYAEKMDIILAGAIADILSMALWSPFDIISSRLQIQRKGEQRYRNGFHAIKLIGQQEGLRGFFRGFGAALLASLPASTTWMFTYEMSKQHLHKAGWGDETPLLHATSGGIAGALSATISNPLEIIKTRMQTQDHTKKGVNLYRSAISGVARIAREEGVLALTKGLMPRLMITVPASAIGLCTYELALRLSRPSNDSLLDKALLDKARAFGSPIGQPSADANTSAWKSKAPTVKDPRMPSLE